MTVLDLQKTLVSELQEFFKNQAYFKPHFNDEQSNKNNTEELKHVNIYEQSLPIKKTDTIEDNEDSVVNIELIDNEESFLPFIIVRVDSGEITKIDRVYNPFVTTVTVYFIIGSFDCNNNMNGHEDTLLIINSLCNYLLENEAIGNFTNKQNIQWALQDEDTSPIFYGVLGVSFESSQNY